MIAKLQQLIKKYAFHIPQSPIKKMQNWGHTETCTLYVKRDDILGPIGLGSKFRKYSSLIPYLKRKNIKEPLVIGGPFSNNLLGLAFALHLEEIHPFFLLPCKYPPSYLGNYLLTSLLVPPHRQYLFLRDNLDEEVRNFTAQMKDSKPFIIPEGASMLASLPGSLSLAMEIHEQRTQKTFDHIFVDAGTGFIAISLILGLAITKYPAQVHVVALAGTEESFAAKLNHWKRALELLLGNKLPPLPSFQLYFPRTCAAFGSTNKEIFDTIADIAENENFLLDPVYSAKMFIESKLIIQERSIKGDALLIHSGGTYALSGFTDELSQTLARRTQMRPPLYSNNLQNLSAAPQAREPGSPINV